MRLPCNARSLIMVSQIVLVAGAAIGQEYPNKPVRIIAPAAGGGADFTARLIAQGLAASLGQPVVVDNRTGILASEAVSKAPPDGYTLLVIGGSLWIGPLLQKMPYEMSDVAAISLTDRTANLLAVHPSLPVKSVTALIALAKTKAGELNYSSSPVGSPNHLAAELFNSMAGVNIVRVVYKGTAQAITALIGGEVQMIITDAGLLTPHAKSGKLRALAVTSVQPYALAPGLPTVAATVPGYESGSVTCVFAPAKTPAAIINRLNQEIVRYLARADVNERFLNTGVEPVGSSPEALIAQIKSDTAKWSKVIKDEGIRID